MCANKTRDYINSRQPRHALTRELYCDEQVYKNDLEHIWYREWIFAGHTFEIDKQGSYFTLQVGDYPILVVRGNDNGIRAFHNTCRHRGSKVCQQDKGKTAKLVCPYHRWTFGLDGKLIYAGNMGQEFDQTQHGLLSVHCEIVETYIFICVSDSAPDFSKFSATVTSFIKPHNLQNCKVAFESNIIEKGNWKLVFENNRECFHCDGAHPELMNSFVENMSVAGIAEEDRELAIFQTECEQAGLPSRLVMDEHGQYRMTRIPLSDHAVSYTMHGQPAVKRRLDNSGLMDIGALLYFHYPSTWNHFLGDHALSFRILPLGLNETLVTTKWLVHKDAVENIDYNLDDLTRVWLATNNQDRDLVEGTQTGISSPAYIPGPFSSVAENGVCQFDDWYCDIMKKRIL